MEFLNFLSEKLQWALKASVEIFKQVINITKICKNWEQETWKLTAKFFKKLWFYNCKRRCSALINPINGV